MKLELRFPSGIIRGEDMRDVISVFPEVEKSFKQRGNFDEYYFFDTFVDIENLNTINKLRELFEITIYNDSLILR